MINSQRIESRTRFLFSFFFLTSFYGLLGHDCIRIRGEDDATVIFGVVAYRIASFDLLRVVNRE